MADNKNTPKPKPSAKPIAPKTVAPKVDIVEEVIEAEVVTIQEPVAPEVTYTENITIFPETPAAHTLVSTAQAPDTVYAVVSNDSVDTVHASKIIPHNLRQKKSLSVHHLQRRLHEWGFTGAYLDKDGYCGEPTLTAITEFQQTHGLPVTGIPDYDTLSRVFEGDTNVKLVP